MFTKLKKFSLPEVEEKILRFWRTNHIFKKTREENRGKKRFIFYEGPPTANGKPGIHHVLARSFKDVILRYKTMRGFDVVRRSGWDTHGLPVELEVEKELGLNSKKEIEAYGVEQFNKKCKESVWRYKNEWERLTERIGFWIDLEHPYITYENSYIETVWWILKQVWQKKLLYKSHKVVPWCPRCGTALSSHELAQGYKETIDTSVVVKFKLKPRQKAGSVLLGNNAYILSWTTTPWTLPGNVALAVGKDISYLIIKMTESGEIYLLANSRKEIMGGGYEVLGKVKGSKLIGLRYIPLFNVKPFAAPGAQKTVYKVYSADFVTTDEGTGVVHIAVMYGEDDYELGKEYNLPRHHTVDETGRFTKDVSGFAGLYVKDKKTEEKILNYLKTKNCKLKTEPYTHEYPFCWRCSTPILYYARDSWFIKMSSLRKKLIDENKKIHWIPAHTKNGRFGEWLRDVRDWALSRERYWGTPLPIWECSGCGKAEAIGSYQELHNRTGGVKNRYLLMRHGEAQSNVEKIVSSSPKDKNRHALTLKGRVQTEKTAKLFKEKNTKIDAILASDFKRTKESAEILGKELGVTIKLDPRLREVNTGEFHNGPADAYHKYFASMQERFSKRPPKGENLRDVAERIYEVLRDAEKKYTNKTILIISHECPLWMLETVMRGWSEEHAVYEKSRREKKGQYDFINVGEVRKTEFLSAPRNLWGFADFHRPYIDKVTFLCNECGGKMKRVPEVIDGWFDSGSMPFAQAHFPFEESIDFPADFIAEGVDQTRGWFYSLLAVAVLLDRESPYKNVISHGLVLDAHGRKMSKSEGNIISPWDVAGQFGIDAVRWYFYTTNTPGEPKRFDKSELKKILGNFIFVIYNSFVFLDTYAGKSKINPLGKPKNVTNVLDRWIFSRLYETVDTATKYLENYEAGEAARRIEGFVNDLSHWYIRRSRRRFQKPKSKQDHESASYTLSFVLLTLSKLIAPFTPFFAEALYQSLKTKIGAYEPKNSVHLEKWPKAEKSMIHKKILNDMKELRATVRLVLAQREEKNIKVRQPLAKVKLKKTTLQNKKDLLQLLKDETNVKRVVFQKNLKTDAELDTELTHKLREEGYLRELVRAIQRMRQDAGLRPHEEIVLSIVTEGEIGVLIKREETFLKKEVRAKKIGSGLLSAYDLSLETHIGYSKLKLALRKI